ncbi:MAG: geranylgeranylglycerol-phosphate geranylgeranyltransferase [Saprospiraceae bacterium]|nr:geranylgeranylglycerol-phosphate geranylgeranyltransferase [Saprospiraceae bacterium]
MKAYISLIRIPNLIIIVLLQSVLYYGILMPAFHMTSISTVFTKLQYPVFVLITLLITAAGYIINDIVDLSTDTINKPQGIIIGKSVTIRNAYLYYCILLALGFVLSIWIAIEITKPFFILLYVIPVLLLYLYSKFLKKSFLAGNILVSLFSAGVPAIILVFEYQGLIFLKSENYSSYLTVLTIFSGLIVFSFFVSLYREVIKDIEDIEGDRIVSAKTLPVISGVETAKAFCGVLAILILLLLFYWLKQPISGTIVKVYTLFAIILPLFYSVWLLKMAVSKHDFHRLSTVVKLIMLMGILMILFYI